MYNPNWQIILKWSNEKRQKIWAGQYVKKCVTLGLKDEKEWARHSVKRCVTQGLKTLSFTLQGSSLYGFTEIKEQLIWKRGIWIKAGGKIKIKQTFEMKSKLYVKKVNF